MFTPSYYMQSMLSGRQSKASHRLEAAQFKVLSTSDGGSLKYFSAKQNMPSHPFTPLTASEVGRHRTEGRTSSTALTM